MKLNRNYTALVLACSIMGLGAKKEIPDEMRMGIPLRPLGLYNIDNTPDPEYIEYEANPPRPDKKGKYDPIDLKFPTRKENILRIYRSTDKTTGLYMPKYNPKTGKQYEFYRGFSWYSDSVDGFSVGDVTKDGVDDIVLKFGDKGAVITFCSKRKIFEKRDIEDVHFVEDGQRMAFTFPEAQHIDSKDGQ